jgi:hypothetical protein
MELMVECDRPRVTLSLPEPSELGMVVEISVEPGDGMLDGGQRWGVRPSS